MQTRTLGAGCVVFVASMFLTLPTFAQMGRRFPSEKKVVPDPVTGVLLTFLTTGPSSDAKIYQTHPQWTADGKWLIFRSSNRMPDQGTQAFAVNEENGDIVQVTDKGYTGMLCVARKSMRLYIMRNIGGSSGQGRGFGRGGPSQIIEIDLAKLFADSEAGTMKPATNYERVCGTIPTNMGAGGDMGLDANEDFAYFRVRGDDVGQHLAPGTKIESGFGPRNMGAGPAGLRSMNLKTGEIKFVVDVPFQIGHVQTNPWVPGEIMFCWETGGKALQRTWTVMADGTGLRPLYPEAPYEWITHEAVITSTEVALAILGHRRVGANDAWGASGTNEHPTGVVIVNLRSREMRIVGQVPLGDPGHSVWHVHGSPNGRWAVADDFMYCLWLIDRHTGEMMLLADMGHKTTAADHIHPTFSADSTKIEIQSAMLAPDGRALDICVVPVPKAWLDRK